MIYVISQNLWQLTMIYLTKTCLVIQNWQPYILILGTHPCFYQTTCWNNKDQATSKWYHKLLYLCTIPIILNFCNSPVWNFGFDEHEFYRLQQTEKSTVYTPLKATTCIFFYPIFTLAAAYIADNLCSKNGNSSFLNLKIRGLHTRAAYDGARTRSGN